MKNQRVFKINSFYEFNIWRAAKALIMQEAITKAYVNVIASPRQGESSTDVPSLDEAIPILEEIASSLYSFQ